jgi:hypothetical protein
MSNAAWTGAHDSRIAEITTRAADLFGRATAGAENSGGTKPLTCEQAIALADV